MEENFTLNLVDAKNQYTKELIDLIYLSMYEGILSIYEDAKILYEDDNTHSCLHYFQKLLCLIPKWDQNLIDTEVDRIKEKSKCDWLEDLLTAVFISHTKILASINKNSNINKLNIKVPKLNVFIHKCYIDVARLFYRNAYLFNHELSKCEIQRNRRESENAIINSINETIRKTLPIKNIISNMDYEKNHTSNDNSIKSLVNDEISLLEKNEKDNMEKKLQESRIKNENLDTNQNQELINDSLAEENNSKEEITNELLAEENNSKEETLNESLVEENNSKEETLNESLSEENNSEVSNTLDNKDLNNEDEQNKKSVSFDENIEKVLNNNDRITDSEIDQLVESGLKQENNLMVENLQLEDFDDLNDLEEIYVDNENIKISIEPETQDDNSKDIDITEENNVLTEENIAKEENTTLEENTIAEENTIPEDNIALEENTTDEENTTTEDANSEEINIKSLDKYDFDENDVSELSNNSESLEEVTLSDESNIKKITINQPSKKDDAIKKKNT